MTALLLLLLAVAPADTMLIDVQLVGTGQHRIMEAVLTPDSILLLPAGDVAGLLGLPPPASPWTTPAELRQQFPSITVTLDLRMLTLFLDDPLGVLPATRTLRDQQQRSARGAPGLMVTRSGPFMVVAGDDREHALVDVGYSWRGRVAVQGRYASAFGSAWAVSVAPSAKFFLSYSDGERQPATVSGRLTTGPFWLSTTWTPDRASVDGLVALGRVKLFASTRDVFILTINGRAGDLQIGRSGGRTTARVSWGPIPASPFSPPLVP